MSPKRPKSNASKKLTGTSPSSCQSISVNDPVTAPWKSAIDMFFVGFTFDQFSSSKQEKTHQSKPGMPVGYTPESL